VFEEDKGTGVPVILIRQLAEKELLPPHKTVRREDLVPDEFIKTLTLKNYSRNTIRTYKTMLQEFLVYYQKLDPEKITDEQIREYLLYLIEQRYVSVSYQNQSINAIKF
jgi:site-specific recombinase XerD